jgi:hypothetical protein
MQGGKNRILPKEMNVNRFFWDSQWLEIWSPLLSLYGTEWRERGYVLWFGPLMAMRIKFGTQITNHI